MGTHPDWFAATMQPMTPLTLRSAGGALFEADFSAIKPGRRALLVNLPRKDSESITGGQQMSRHNSWRHGICWCSAGFRSALRGGETCEALPSAISIPSTVSDQGGCW